MKIEPCQVCGTHFDNIFEAADHLTDEDNEPQFDPTFVLKSGYSLRIGTMLRLFYERANDPDQVKELAENTYGTLFAADINPSLMRQYVEDSIVAEHMYGVDAELKQLLDKKPNDDNESGA